MTNKTAKFTWNDENTAQLVELYTACLESEGADVASSNDKLAEFAKAVGASTHNQARAKLSKEGVYESLSKPASIAKTGKLQKEHYVRALAHTLNIDADDLESFKNATVASLKALTDSLGIKDIAAASAKDYSPRPEMIVMQIAECLEVDFDSLDAYNEELTEAAETETE